MESSLDHEVLEYLQQTYAKSTQRVYKTQKDSYFSFCAFMGYAPVPASTTVLCLYAAMLGRTLKYSTVKQYLCIIKKLHKEWNLPDPILDNYQLNSVLKGMRRALGDTPSRKLPVDRDLLLQILSQLNLRSIQDRNIWAAAVLMFFAMLHRANVLTTSQTFNRNKHLNRQDITFYPWGAKVHIRWTKTIQFKERTLDIPLPHIHNSPLCPVQAIITAYSSTSGASPMGPAFLSDGLKPLTPSIFVSRIRHILAALGVNPKNYAGHSFRRGGATWAYKCGVPVDTIRIIGDWKSNSYTAYLECSDQLIRNAVKLMIEHSDTT